MPVDGIESLHVGSSPPEHCFTLFGSVSEGHDEIRRKIKVTPGFTWINENPVLCPTSKVMFVRIAIPWKL